MPFRPQAWTASPHAAATAAATAADETREMIAGAPTPVPESGLVELWNRLIEAVGRVSQFTRTYLLEAHPVSFSNKVFTIGFDPQFEDHIGLVDNTRNHTLLQTKLLELGHANAQIKFIKAEAPARQAAAPAAPASAAAVSPRRRQRKSRPRCRSIKRHSRTIR